MNINSISVQQGYDEYHSRYGYVEHVPNGYKTIEFNIDNDGWDYQPFDVFPIAVGNKRFEVVLTELIPEYTYQDMFPDRITMRGHLI